MSSAHRGLRLQTGPYCHNASYYSSTKTDTISWKEAGNGDSGLCCQVKATTAFPSELGVAVKSGVEEPEKMSVMSLPLPFSQHSIYIIYTYIYIGHFYIYFIYTVYKHFRINDSNRSADQEAQE